MSIWRSVMAAKASLSRHSFSNHSLPSSQTLITRILHPAPPFSPQNTSPRFFSQTSDSESDRDKSPAISAVNGGLQADHLSPAELGDVGNVQFEGSVAAAEEEERNDEVSEEQLEKLLSLLQSSSGGGESLQSSLDSLDLNPSQDFVVRALETPQISSPNLIAFVNWAVKKPDFRVTSRILDSLVKAVCSNGLSKSSSYSLWDLVKQISENEPSALTSETLNHLIAQLSKLGKPKAAVEIFEKFPDLGLSPNENTYYFTIEALCRRSMYEWAWSICEKMVSVEKLPESEKLGKIISWLCKGKSAKEAHSVYTLAKEKKIVLPLRSINFLVGSLCREDETVILALQVLDHFEGKVRNRAIKPFSATIRGFCRSQNMSEAKKLLLEMISGGPPPGNAVFNSVAHGFSKSGEMGEAVQILSLMKSRGLKPDVFTYTVLISGYSNLGQMDKARKVLAEAEKRHEKLSPVTYHSVIRGYCKLGEFDKALEVLADMESHGGVMANSDEYNKLIQSLCLKALDWETAEKLLEEVEEKGLCLNEMTKGLVRAVKEMVHQEIETGKKLE